MPEVILPGTYITVRDEGLIRAGGVVSGYIGIVGTAEKGPLNEVKILGSLTEAKEMYGNADPWVDGESNELTLVRALELAYKNGAKTVYAVRVATNALADYEQGLALLENEIVNIIVLAGQDVSVNGMASALQGHLNTTAQIKRERIGLIGSNGNDDVTAISGHTLNSDRLIFVAPGVRVADNVLPGGYLAAAIAGLISSLPVQASPTNKPVTIDGLSTAFSSSKLEKLVQSRVLAVEKREGYRVVKGITTATNSAWHQITTRRIVDYALYGTRSACDPYIGKLNNERVRSAMKATLDGFLTRMVENEALQSYDLEVSATRDQEIQGQAIVSMTIRPTFSIDFILVTMNLG